MTSPTALKIEHASHPGSSFVDAALSGSIFQDVGLQQATFENVALTDAVFKNVCLAGVSIVDANLEGTRIDGVLVTDLLQAYQALLRGSGTPGTGA